MSNPHARIRLMAVKTPPFDLQRSIQVQIHRHKLEDPKDVEIPYRGMGHDAYKRPQPQRPWAQAF